MPIQVISIKKFILDVYPCEVYQDLKIVIISVSIAIATRKCHVTYRSVPDVILLKVSLELFKIPGKSDFF